MPENIGIINNSASQRKVDDDVIGELWERQDDFRIYGHKIGTVMLGFILVMIEGPQKLPSG